MLAGKKCVYVKRFDLADTTWGRYEKINIIIFLPTPI
jgi:hypothetical protein